MKRTEMCYVHVLTPHGECSHWVLQTYTNENLKKNFFLKKELHSLNFGKCQHPVSLGFKRDP